MRLGRYTPRSKKWSAFVYTLRSVTVYVFMFSLFVIMKNKVRKLTGYMNCLEEHMSWNSDIKYEGLFVTDLKS